MKLETALRTVEYGCQTCNLTFYLTVQRRQWENAATWTEAPCPSCGGQAAATNTDVYVRLTGHFDLAFGPARLRLLTADIPLNWGSEGEPKITDTTADQPDNMDAQETPE